MTTLLTLALIVAIIVTSFMWGNTHPLTTQSIFTHSALWLSKAAA